MTTSQLPWTTEVINHIPDGVPCGAFILDRFGTRIGHFYSWQDAEAVISSIEDVDKLRERIAELEYDLDLLQTNYDSLLKEQNVTASH